MTRGRGDALGEQGLVLLELVVHLLQRPGRVGVGEMDLPLPVADGPAEDDRRHRGHDCRLQLRVALDEVDLGPRRSSPS
jgi:hypothetical protein